MSPLLENFTNVTCFRQDNPEDLMELTDKVGITLKQIKEPVLSIIIPVLNEASNIVETLNNVIKVSWIYFISVILFN